MTALLEIEHLRVLLQSDGVRREVVRDVSLTISAGESVGLVGESGSGKSMTARSILRLLPGDAVISGSIRLDGREVLELTLSELRSMRNSDTAMIFQDPRAHINPLHTIGSFLTEGLRVNDGLSSRAATTRARELLDIVRISDPDRRLRQYPHELSGGMLQRVMIAAALASKPRLLLADEPTTALDVTTQAEVMAILSELRRDSGLAILFITHDLELAAATCDRTAVMYAGSIVEDQPSEALRSAPRHPYTAALLASRPMLDAPADRLAVIAGRAVAAFEAPTGCAFHPRCHHAIDECRVMEPKLVTTGSLHVACLRVRGTNGSAPFDHHDGAVCDE